jgi:aldehyde dehydrogenase (NAD+)
VSARRDKINMSISEIVKNQREYFKTGKTRPISERRNALVRLRSAIKSNEEAIYQALLDDLNKPRSESYVCEIGLVYEEIGYQLRNVGKWARARRVKTPLAHFSSKSFVSPEPYGTVLIMSPWNYPIQLTLSPLAGAIAAGNTAVIKPSAYAPRTSSVISKIISDAFVPEYITVVEGGREENSALLDEKFDYIFFTGSTAVGRLVMERASRHLTPVSLELGGKSPTIVDESADIALSARRIAFGKTVNAGQTCVAPDYLFIHKSVKERFVECYKKALSEFFPGGDLSDMPHIINDKHFKRLVGLMDGERCVVGGGVDEAKRLIEPTLLDGVTYESKIMGEEIFGPILPMIEYENIDECINYIRSGAKPLALYLFTRDKSIENRILNSCSFGGGCINDTIIHVATTEMGFGGVGESGMGAYHGKSSFDTFTHYRSIIKKRLFPDLKMRYRPYTEAKDRLIKKFLK